MRKRARHSAKRFTEEEFARGWVGQMDILVKLRERWAGDLGKDKKL